MKSTPYFSIKPLTRRILIAMLAAIQLVMVATGLAYIPIGPFRLTFLTLPVAVGGALLGPAAGAILGTVFGLSSFVTCFTGDPLGAILVSIQPIYMFAVCVVPRVLCGVLPALVCRRLHRSDRRAWLAFGSACLLTPLINTVGFLGSMWLFYADDFVHSAALIDLFGEAVASIVTLFVTLAGVNALLEAAVGVVVGTAVCKVLSLWLKRAHA